MSRLQYWAERQPEHPAMIEAETGAVVTFGVLHERVQRLSTWLLGRGVAAGAGLLVLSENRPEMIEIGLMARRTGLYYTPVSTHLTEPELAHIVGDSQVSLLFVSGRFAPVAHALEKLGALVGITVILLDTVSTFGFARVLAYEHLLQVTQPLQTMPLRPLGRDMLYSSGTTGFPKGVRRALVAPELREQPEPEVLNWQRSFGFDAHTVYLSPAPLYHAAPLRYVMRTIEGGGTAVLMKKFEAVAALSAIQRYRVTHSQWVPTMFVRILELPEATRSQFDLSSMRVAIHAAAPCPIHVKQALLAWWGDILFEYYAGSEGFGVTAINALEWRAKPGSVGRPTLGVLHITDEEGCELPIGEIGKIYFSGGPSFAYWNDPQKTKEAYHPKGWATYGDMGYVDAEGYLFLADRRTDLILSGGVNLYPQEIENALSQHPLVQDVAVVGVPHADLGQVPKAVVQLHNHALASRDLAQELIEFCVAHLSKVKMPRTIVFETSLPRLETGKLLRRVLKERYQQDPDAGFRVKP